MRRGEIRASGSHETILSIMGMTVFYFVSTPVARAIGTHDPLLAGGAAQPAPPLIDHVTAILRPEASHNARGKTL